ncbi:MAG TPA: nucleoside recognition domain-containing protein [Anaeromyxobacteraceae bacterium]|nr:nucleoside recognition domain-containing protein [Anaeromyxobacteraceae bacterium]
MSVVWVLILAGSVLAAAATGRVGDLPGAIADSAGKAIATSIGLAGVLALWLGLMRVAERAGLVDALGRLARPLLRRLFPEVQAGSPAMGAMVMNISANMLGLGNAATPFGIKAMEELEKENPHPGTATDAQALLCAMNTASLQLVPATVIALRAAAGARQPADILGATLVASSCAVVTAVAAAKLLRRLYPAPAARRGAPGEGTRA